MVIGSTAVEAQLDDVLGCGASPFSSSAFRFKFNMALLRTLCKVLM